MIYNVITIACLVLLAIEVLYVALNIFVKERAARISFVREFKNGKCAIVYFTAIPIYYMGIYYADGQKNVWDTLFDTVKEDDIIKELQEMELSSMTPIDALNTLYRLQTSLKNRW